MNDSDDTNHTNKVYDMTSCIIVTVNGTTSSDHELIM